MSEHETTTHDPGQRPGAPSGPDSPGHQARKIVGGGGTIDEKWARLKELEARFPGDEGVVGYFESLAMQRDLQQRGATRTRMDTNDRRDVTGVAGEIEFLVSYTTPDAEALVRETGALDSVERALRRAHAVLDTDGKRLARSAVVERELKKEGWSKKRVWAPPGLPRRANDSFDGWKDFDSQSGSKIGVAVEVEFTWYRVFFDFLKFWRGQRGGQIGAGIVVLRKPSAFHYAYHHQFALYRDLFPELVVAFCALNDPELDDPKYQETS